MSIVTSVSVCLSVFLSFFVYVCVCVIENILGITCLNLT